MRYVILFLFTCTFMSPLVAQQLTVEKDLRADWLIYEDSVYRLVGDESLRLRSTLYFEVQSRQFPGRLLSIQSTRPYFVFFDGKLAGEYQHGKVFNLDSLAMVYYTTPLLVGIYQPDINARDMKTALVSRHKEAPVFNPPFRPSTFFKDFVIVAGLVIILLFLIIARLNPKLAADYFSVIRIFSLRENDDAQSNARLASSTNIQFYITCSLLLGFYFMIILHHLPDAYALPLYFEGNSFWTVVWQWLRLSTMILGVLFAKVLFIFSLTRLFGMRGTARVHFFNWIRLLLIVIGAFSVILFVYYISRGQSPGFFTTFLMLVIGTLIAWVIVVFLKLNGKSEHSMFHLFSYICATEIIPLLITIKVLFQ